MANIIKAPIKGVTTEEPSSSALGKDIPVAMVELEHRKLDREALVLLGMREMLEKYRGAAKHMGDAAHSLPYAQAMWKLALMLDEEYQAVTLALYKSAQRTGAVTVHDLKSSTN